ncbi:MAG: hypothetical protein KA764_08375 [Anaerolineales bacterium]|nr:hypothetical protein [Anaerolineales bacterium]
MPPKPRTRTASDPTRYSSILANLFSAAQPAVQPLTRFRWHSAAGERYDTWKVQSSQALAIDVFGTLQTAPARDAVLDRWAGALGVPAGGPWAVQLEWHDPDNHLGEQQPTWVDAVAQSPHALIFFEGKFTESDGGRCSQTQPLRTGPHRGRRQCDGRYMFQVNPATGQEARCALTAKGLRYWDEIPRVFDYDAGQSYFECPFAGPWFQWMRNLTVCHAAARATRRAPAFVLAYADGPGLPMAARVRGPEWARLQDRLQPGAITLRALAYQTLIQLAETADPDNPVWPALGAWVQGKIDTVCGPPPL